MDQIRAELPGCIITKQDARYIQGIPDWCIFYKNKWAMLECKKSAHEKPRPNQPYYVKKCDSMSFARFVWPENAEDVLNDLLIFFKGE